MKKWLVWPLFSLVYGSAHSGSLVGLTPDELEAMKEKGALVVDVRTPKEWKATGVIPGSKELTYFDETGHYDKDNWLKQLKTVMKPDQPIILVCRSGNRSATVGKMLVDEAGFAKAYHLEKGIKVWSAESHPLSAQ